MYPDSGNDFSAGAAAPHPHVHPHVSARIEPREVASKVALYAERVLQIRANLETFKPGTSQSNWQLASRMSGKTEDNSKGICRSSSPASKSNDEVSLRQGGGANADAVRKKNEVTLRAALNTLSSTSKLPAMAMTPSFSANRIHLPAKSSHGDRKDKEISSENVSYQLRPHTAPTMADRGYGRAYAPRTLHNTPNTGHHGVASDQTRHPTYTNSKSTPLFEQDCVDLGGKVGAATSFAESVSLSALFLNTSNNNNSRKRGIIEGVHNASAVHKERSEEQHLFTQSSPLHIGAAAYHSQTLKDLKQRAMNQLMMTHSAEQLFGLDLGRGPFTPTGEENVGGGGANNNRKDEEEEINDGVDNNVIYSSGAFAAERDQQRSGVDGAVAALSSSEWSLRALPSAAGVGDRATNTSRLPLSPPSSESDFRTFSSDRPRGGAHIHTSSSQPINNTLILAPSSSSVSASPISEYARKFEYEMWSKVALSSINDVFTTTTAAVNNKDGRHTSSADRFEMQREEGDRDGDRRVTTSGIRRRIDEELASELGFLYEGEGTVRTTSAQRGTLTGAGDTSDYASVSSAHRHRQQAASLPADDPTSRMQMFRHELLRRIGVPDALALKALSSPSAPPEGEILKKDNNEEKKEMTDDSTNELDASPLFAQRVDNSEITASPPPTLSAIQRFVLSIMGEYESYIKYLVRSSSLSAASIAAAALHSTVEELQGKANELESETRRRVEKDEESLGLKEEIARLLEQSSVQREYINELRVAVAASNNELLLLFDPTSHGIVEEDRISRKSCDNGNITTNYYTDQFLLPDPIASTPQSSGPYVEAVKRLSAEVAALRADNIRLSSEGSTLASVLTARTRELTQSQETLTAIQLQNAQLRSTMRAVQQYATRLEVCLKNTVAARDAAVGSEVRAAEAEVASMMMAAAAGGGGGANINLLPAAFCSSTSSLLSPPAAAAAASSNGPATYYSGGGSISPQQAFINKAMSAMSPLNGLQMNFSVAADTTSLAILAQRAAANATTSATATAANSSSSAPSPPQFPSRYGPAALIEATTLLLQPYALDSLMSANLVVSSSESNHAVVGAGGSIPASSPYTTVTKTKSFSVKNRSQLLMSALFSETQLFPLMLTAAHTFYPPPAAADVSTHRRLTLSGGNNNMPLSSFSLGTSSLMGAVPSTCVGAHLCLSDGGPSSASSPQASPAPVQMTLQSARDTFRGVLAEMANSTFASKRCKTVAGILALTRTEAVETFFIEREECGGGVDDEAFRESVGGGVRASSPLGGGGGGGRKSLIQRRREGLIGRTNSSGSLLLGGGVSNGARMNTDRNITGARKRAMIRSRRLHLLLFQLAERRGVQMGGNIANWLRAAEEHKYATFEALAFLLIHRQNVPACAFSVVFERMELLRKIIAANITLAKSISGLWGMAATAGVVSSSPIAALYQTLQQSGGCVTTPATSSIVSVAVSGAARPPSPSPATTSGQRRPSSASSQAGGASPTGRRPSSSPPRPSISGGAAPKKGKGAGRPDRVSRYEFLTAVAAAFPNCLSADDLDSLAGYTVLTQQQSLVGAQPGPDTALLKSCITNDEICFDVYFERLSNPPPVPTHASWGAQTNVFDMLCRLVLKAGLTYTSALGSVLVSMATKRANRAMNSQSERIHSQGLTAVASQGSRNSSSVTESNTKKEREAEVEETRGDNTLADESESSKEKEGFASPARARSAGGPNQLLDTDKTDMRIAPLTSISLDDIVAAVWSAVRRPPLPQTARDLEQQAKQGQDLLPQEGGGQLRPLSAPTLLSASSPALLSPQISSSSVGRAGSVQGEAVRASPPPPYSNANPDSTQRKLLTTTVAWLVGGIPVCNPIPTDPSFYEDDVIAVSHDADNIDDEEENEVEESYSERGGGGGGGGGEVDSDGNVHVRVGRSARHKSTSRPSSSPCRPQQRKSVTGGGSNSNAITTTTASSVSLTLVASQSSEEAMASLNSNGGRNAFMAPSLNPYPTSVYVTAGDIESSVAYVLGRAEGCVGLGNSEDEGEEAAYDNDSRTDYYAAQSPFSSPSRPSSSPPQATSSPFATKRRNFVAAAGYSKRKSDVCVGGGDPFFFENHVSRPQCPMVSIRRVLENLRHNVFILPPIPELLQ